MAATSPSLETISKNAQALRKELQWLDLIIKTRFQLYFDKESEYSSVLEHKPPVFSDTEGCYAEFINKYKLSFPQRMVLILGLAPHIKPEVLDNFYTRNTALDKRYTQFGGAASMAHTGFIPTVETAYFLFAGDDLEARFLLSTVFDVDQPLLKEGVLRVEAIKEKEPFQSGKINISQEYIEYFTIGVARKPDFSAEFPAKLITTELEWEELVLHAHTRQYIREILDWIEYSPTMMNGWGMKRKIKPGYRSLFYGPPGTGKTLTASLLGKMTKRDVYRIDLSMIISKYIGETEKNLARVFDKAENKDWILFFDEADALFGKRTEIQNSHDRFANQDVAYLLQRIEDFPGLVILASNLKENIDDAFTRRFQSVIYFPMPSIEERWQIWKQAFSDHSHLHDKVNLREIAEKHVLSGALIMNAVHYSSIRALKRGEDTITLDDLEAGIKREFHKDGILLM